MLPKWLAWATVVIGASLLTPMGFFGFILLPVWLFVTGFWLTFRDSAARGTGGVAEHLFSSRAAEAVFRINRRQRPMPP